MQKPAEGPEGNSSKNYSNCTQRVCQLYLSKLSKFVVCFSMAKDSG